MQGFTAKNAIVIDPESSSFAEDYSRAKDLNQLSFFLQCMSIILQIIRLTKINY
jgi:hypothetical protein